MRIENTMDDTDHLPTTPARLTAAMREAGMIGSASVSALTVTERVKTTVSNLWFLTASYGDDARPAPPQRLLLKWPLADLPPPDHGAEEPAFYNFLAPRVGSPPILRSVAASRGLGRQWVVVEDLRATHQHPQWPGRPSDHELRSAVAVLARLHATWWEPREGDANVGWTRHTEASVRAMVGGIAHHLPAFFDDLGETLPAADRAVLETVFGSSLRPWLRLVDHRNLTIAHGDAHTWNFLFPRPGERGTYLIDWQTWHLDVGARDLAYMIALHWDRETRERVERPLLELYHRCLIAEGRENYSFDELWLEYRRCVVRNLTFPIIYWSRGFKPEAWRHRLSSALAAYQDLACQELL